MPFQVTIKPSGHTFTADDKETVLAGALREGYVLPYGCRNGACGTCKGKIIEGSVDYGNPQPSVLAEFEKKAGYALFCQATPTSDLIIDPGRDPGGAVPHIRHRRRPTLRRPGPGAA